MGFERNIVTLEKEICAFRDENQRLMAENQKLQEEQKKLLLIINQMRETINRLLSRYVLTDPE